MVNPFLQAREAVAATPSLVVDSGIVQRNLQRCADYAQQHQLRVRPHTKTHKSREMAQRQLALGAIGLTVAKVGEADAFVPDCSDLLIAYPVVDPYRARWIAELAKTITVRVASDSEEGIQALAAAAGQAGSTIGILVDLDVGFHRTGVDSPDSSRHLAQLVASLAPALRLDGMFIYPGHVWAPADQQIAELQKIDGLLEQHLDAWKRSSLPCGIISGGSTPTLYQSHHISRQTEIRPGTYLYNDMNTVRGGHCELQDCGAAIVCTVVSRSVSSKAVLDGGTKTFTSDRNVTQPDSGHGYILEYPQARLVRLSEEHGEVDMTHCETRPRVGERVTVIPNHICPCINLQDTFQLLKTDGTVRAFPVDSRGRLV